MPKVTKTSTATKRSASSPYAFSSARRPDHPFKKGYLSDEDLMKAMRQLALRWHLLSGNDAIRILEPMHIQFAEQLQTTIQLQYAFYLSSGKPSCLIQALQVCDAQHWILAVYNWEQKTVCLIDSVDGVTGLDPEEEDTAGILTETEYDTFCEWMFQLVPDMTIHRWSTTVQKLYRDSRHCGSWVLYLLDLLFQHKDHTRLSEAVFAAIHADIHQAIAASGRTTTVFLHGKMQELFPNW